jgi:RNA polymerase sigma-70 factor (ECF subfamily)
MAGIHEAEQPAADAVLDEYLVVQSQLGDADAFRRLVRRWHERILGRALHFTRDPEAAKDVAQESWVAVVRGLRSLRDPARFPAWTLQIVAHKARDWVRREEARRRAARRAEPDSSPSDTSEHAASIERVRAGLVRAGLARLDPARRSILRRFYLEGMSVAEIAEALGIPAGTVKSRLFHARDALRALLEEK